MPKGMSPNKLTRAWALGLVAGDGTRLKATPTGAILVLNPGVAYSKKWLSNAYKVGEPDAVSVS